MFSHELLESSAGDSAAVQGDADSDQDTAVLVLLHLCQLCVLCHLLWPHILFLCLPRAQLSFPTHPLVGKCSVPGCMLTALWFCLSI